MSTSTFKRTESYSNTSSFPPQFLASVSFDNTHTHTQRKLSVYLSFFFSLTKQFIQNMIIKITRENSSYRERERERKKKTYIFISTHIFVETNQPTNQPTPQRASSYLPRLKLPPALHGSKAPLARWLVRHMRDLCDGCSFGDIFLAFEKKKSQSQSQSQSV